MTLRSKIVAIIELDIEASLSAWKILCMLEDTGLSLFGNGFLEHDAEYEPGCNYFGITKVIAGEEDIHLTSMKVISKLEEIGLSLSGNGWLDDDKEAIDYLDIDSDGDFDHHEFDDEN